jgi:hypothetical protein
MTTTHLTRRECPTLISVLKGTSSTAPFTTTPHNQERNETPSVFHQRHIGRVPRLSCILHGEPPANTTQQSTDAQTAPPAERQGR